MLLPLLVKFCLPCIWGGEEVLLCCSHCSSTSACLAQPQHLLPPWQFSHSRPTSQGSLVRWNWHDGPSVNVIMERCFTLILCCRQFPSLAKWRAWVLVSKPFGGPIWSYFQLLICSMYGQQTIWRSYMIMVFNVNLFNVWPADHLEVPYDHIFFVNLFNVIA